MKKTYMLLAFLLLFVTANAQITMTIGNNLSTKVSERLLGFNTVYAKSPDSVWESGELVAAIKACKPAFLRYPGGTVNTYFHWNEPTGNGWEDSWNPKYDKSTNRPSSEYMDIDEYFKIIDATGAEPLIGINNCSGFVWNRVEDGIEEALALMQYCKEKGYKVEYWYLGNEPYMKGCNGGPYTVAEYAEQINVFATRLKAFDPNIKLIANWHATFRKHGNQYRELFALAGNNIDVIDIHLYNMWGQALWSEWLSHDKCGVFTGDAYEDEITTFHTIAKECGYPDMKLASLEWNVGPGKLTTEQRLTPSQTALVQSEMMIQFINGGLDMATFWPLFWDGDFAFRSFFDKQSGKPMPIAAILAVFGGYQGAEKLKCAIEGDKSNRVQAVAVEKNGKQLYCILNKNDESVDVGLNNSERKMRRSAVQQFVYDFDSDSLVENRSKINKLDGISLPPFSLTFITLNK